MRAVVEWIRRKNRARLERRRRRRAGGLSRLEAEDHERLAGRRLRQQLLASLASNDTAMLEALVFLLRSSRQDQRARAEADEALAKGLGALGERVEAGLRLLDERLRAVEARLVTATRGGAAEPVPVELQPRSERAGRNGDGRGGDAK